jgi:hypothetical protein
MRSSINDRSRQMCSSASSMHTAMPASSNLSCFVASMRSGLYDDRLRYRSRGRISSSAVFCSMKTPRLDARRLIPTSKSNWFHTLPHKRWTSSLAAGSRIGEGNAGDFGALVGAACSRAKTPGLSWRPQGGCHPRAELLTLIAARQMGPRLTNF